MPQVWSLLEEAVPAEFSPKKVPHECHGRLTSLGDVAGSQRLSYAAKYVLLGSVTELGC